MDQKILSNLESILVKYKNLETKLLELSTKSLTHDYIAVSKEHSSFKNIVSNFIAYKKLLVDLDNVKTLLDEKDDTLYNLALDELKSLEDKKQQIETQIYFFLKSDDEYVSNNVFLELRAASGGDESAIFVEDLLKMYLRYFDTYGWQQEILSFSCGKSGGYKEVIIRIIGSGIFCKLKHESGTHRVQRVPKTDAHGRVHTSTSTVAVLPELPAVENIDFDFNDLRIDTYRASGAGGQHVNVTDSAVRITHIPSGIIAECQNERSQHKNKQKALSLLKSRLLAMERNKQKTHLDSYRKTLLGSGSRSEKIRTYNYTDNRITDHRLNLTLYRLSDVMNGNLDLIISCF